MFDVHFEMRSLNSSKDWNPNPSAKDVLTRLVDKKTKIEDFCVLIINSTNTFNTTQQIYTHTNMLSLTRIATIRTASHVLPNAAAAASGISSRFFTGIGDDLDHKVRVKK
jgi:hypothetical protein